jgi:hypothetical protein
MAAAGAFRLVLTIAVAVMTLAAARGDPPPTESPAGAVPVAPERERTLLGIVADAREELRAGRSATPARDARLGLQIRVITLLRHDGSASDWVGTVATHGVTAEGNAWVTIDIGEDVLIATWDTAADDVFSGTLVRPGSPIFPLLHDIRIGQHVVFSGNFVRFVPASDEDMIDRPKFIVRFSAIKPVP